MSNLVDRMRARLAARESQGPVLAPVPTAPLVPTITPIERRRMVRMEAAEQLRDPVTAGEMQRITALPVQGDITPAEFEVVNRQTVLAPQFDRGWRLFPCQAQAYLEFQIYGGAFCPIGVGWGKTLITLLAADHAFRNDPGKTLLVVPASVYPQLMQRDLKWARTKVSLAAPLIGLGGRRAPDRKQLAKSGRRGVYVLPSSLFSVEDTREILDLVDPSLIIIDEAHEFKRHSSARTKRLLDFIEERNPAGVCLSGTITDKSIEDYHHLISWCLGPRSPLPNQKSTAKTWGAVIDSKAQPTESMMAVLRPLVDWTRRWFPQETISFDKTGFRKAYRYRLATAPGVTATADAEIGTSLTIKNVEVDLDQFEGAKELRAHIWRLENEWVTPAGDYISHAVSSHKWHLELSSGFYNQLTWPSPKALAERRDLELDEAEDLITAAQIHHRDSQKYTRELRDWLKDNATLGMDTPMLVGAEMLRNGPKNVGHDLYRRWCIARASKVEAIPEWEKHKIETKQRALERDKTAVRVCPFKVQTAVDLALELHDGKHGTLLWYQHIEIGQWLAELLKGHNFVHCPEGSHKTILDSKHENKILLASIPAHYQGKNLQPYQRTVFCEFPRSARICQQVLGRNHRNGQEADHLDVYTLRSTPFDHESFSACLIDSLYIHQTTADRQRVVYCGYDPQPEIFPDEVLRERGFDVSALDSDAQQVLQEKFGDIVE